MAVASPSQERALDNDVLRHIVSYLPPEELTRVNSTNSVFHSEYLRLSYRSLLFKGRDKNMKRLLKHLADREAYAVGWVRQVEIQPWLVSPHTKTSRSFTERLIIGFSKIIDPHYTAKVTEQRLHKRLKKDRDRVNAAFRRMGGVEEYTVVWDEGGLYHPELYKDFLAPVLGLWSAHLVKLTLKVPPNFLNSLAHVRLPKLETFHHTFATGHLAAADIGGTLDGFIVFVNNLRDSLRILSFISTNSSHHFDMSHVFQLLGRFPRLKSVSISIPFDGAHLRTPQHFVDFLDKHRQQLREVNLYTNKLSVRREEGTGDPDSINWIQRILTGMTTPFPRLRSFGVAVRPVRHPLDDLAKFLDVHTSITSLKLLDKSLSVEDLRALFCTDQGALLRHSLSSLHIKVDAIDPYLVEILSMWFPNLDTLVVECYTVSYYTQRNITRNRSGKGLVAEFSAYLRSPEIQPFVRSWKLNTLKLYHPSHEPAIIDAFQAILHEFLPLLNVLKLDETALPHGHFIC